MPISGTFKEQQTNSVLWKECSSSEGYKRRRVLTDESESESKSKSFHDRLVEVLEKKLRIADDYLIRIIPKYLIVFRVVNYSGRKSSMEIQLSKRNKDLMVSAVEKMSQINGGNPSFPCPCRNWEKFPEFDSILYVSPYTGPGGLVDGRKSSKNERLGYYTSFSHLQYGKSVDNEVSSFQVRV